MKKTLLYLSLLGAAWLGHSQSKTTGVVTLGSNMSAEIVLDDATDVATLTFTGPSDRWFALQFGSFGTGDGMENGQDCVYYNGTTLVDAKMTGLGGFPSVDATNNWSVSSNTVTGTTRTIVATRDFSTGDSNDFIFNYSSSDIDFVWARASSSSFSMAYHGSSNRGYAINNSLVLGLDGFQVSQVKLYPNPSKSSFFIESEIPVNKIRVYNTDGQVVLNSEITDMDKGIDITSFTKGVYFVELESVEGTLYKKLIKE